MCADVDNTMNINLQTVSEINTSFALDKYFLSSLSVTDYFWKPASSSWRLVYALCTLAEKTSLVRAEPIIASAAVTTCYTTREPSHSPGKTMTVQVHSFHSVGWREKHRLL